MFREFVVPERVVFDAPEERDPVVGQYNAIGGDLQTPDRFADHLARMPT
ncbi:MAG: hypothetical protein IPM20_04735 [Gammaproteobacteria bacterium]|nr:hypothetical protein [Gammaproteobacteria bacterium]